FVVWPFGLLPAEQCYLMQTLCTGPFQALLGGCPGFSPSLPSSCLNSSSSFDSSLLSLRASINSGRSSHVLPRDCFSLQRRIAAWLPDSSTSGTRRPR